MGALFGGSAPKVTRMPDMQDPAIGDAQARKRQQIASRSGRDSTKMSNRQPQAGTASYTNSLLGSAG